METRSEVMVKKQMIKGILLSEDIKTELENKKQIIFEIIPELEAEDGFEHKHPHHCYDVWQHTTVALQNSKPDLQIRMALLLHDIGKPHCYQEDNGIRHFYGHANVSEKMSEKILKGLRFNEKEAQDICYLVKEHDTIIDVNNLDNMNLDMVDKLLHIQYCDAYAHAPQHIEKRVKKLDEIKEQIEQHKRQKEEKNLESENER